MNQTAAKVSRRLDVLEESISTGRRRPAASPESVRARDANRALNGVNEAFNAAHEAAHSAFNDLVKECDEGDSAR